MREPRRTFAQADTILPPRPAWTSVRYQQTGVGEGRKVCIMEASERMWGETATMTSANSRETKECYYGERYRSGGRSTAATKTPITSPPTKDINRFQPTEVGCGRKVCIMEASKRMRGGTETMNSTNSREMKSGTAGD